jgi:MFS family permease
VVIAQICAMPLAIASPLMPTFWMALGGQLLYSTALMIGAPSQLAAMQVVTPNEMRAQINAVYMFTVGVIGSGFGPTIIALVTDYLFHDESQLRYAMVTSTAVAMPIALFCTWRAMKAYGPLYRETVKGVSS